MEELVEIQKALIKGELANAIKGMFAYDSEHNNDRLSNQIIHQSGRYHANEKSNNAGMMSADQYNRTTNQLRHALLQLLAEFPGYTAEVKKRAQEAIVAEQVEEVTDVVPKQAPVEPEKPEEETVWKILMLSSNPSDTGMLQLEKEHSRISRQIQNSVKAGNFPIKSRQAVTLSGFTEALLDERPAIVHFSGHGEMSTKEIKKAGSRGAALEEDAPESESTGIILTSDDDISKSHFVHTGVIQEVFQSMIDLNIPIQVVIFNSCYSEAQAQALANLVPHVIGTTSSVNDDAAIAFAKGFYSFLTRTKDFKAAWKNGRIQAMGKGEPKERFIYIRNGDKVDL